MLHDADSKTEICPWCSHGLSADRVCASCGKRLDPGDWPVGAAYSAKGLQATADGGCLLYSLPVSPEVRQVTLSEHHHLPRVIPDQDPISVGNTLSDIIRIESPSPVRAIFYRNRRTKECWVLDQSSFASVRVNGGFERNKRLRANDKIDIAGVCLIFDGECIDVDRETNSGVTLSVHEVSVAVDGRDILRNVSFSVSPGGFVGIIGPSGCGKSTLLQRIVGLTNPRHCSGGSVRFNGADSDSLPYGSVGICAYLPQNAEEMLHPGLTLFEEMKCFLAIHGCGAEDESQIEPLLDLLGLRGEINNPIAMLSGGQKRRAAIAMTLLRKPQIVLLDEPTAGLDPASDAEVMNYLRKIAENKRITILCTTHVLGNMDCFTCVLALTGRKKGDSSKNGRLVFRDNPKRLVNCICPNLGDVTDAGSMAKVYETLLAGAPELPSLQDDENGGRSCRPEDVPHGMPPALASFKGYVRRMWTSFLPKSKAAAKQLPDFIGELFRPLVNVARLMCSAVAIIFLWMPLGVVACIRIGCADDFYTPSTGAIYFKCIIAMFLLGLCHSATRLVDGRIPGRCLERLAGVSVSAYLAAKVVGSVALCAVQTLSFCFLWLVSTMLPGDWFSPTVHNTVPIGPFATFWTIPVLFFVSLIGSLVGLSISAMVKSRATAVNMVPVVAVIVLFFSQPNIGYSLSDVANSKRNSSPTLAERISYCTPTVYPQRFLTSAYQVAAARNAVHFAEQKKGTAVTSERKHLNAVKDDCRSVVWRLAVLFVFYLVFSYCLLWFFEPSKEKQWNGR